MYSSKSANRLLSLLLAFLLLPLPLVITRQASAAAIGQASSIDQNDDAQESLTLDSLLGADSYMLYGELRNVGAQAQSGGLMNLVEPLIPLLGGMPREMAGITAFISKHSSTLSRSRMMIAAMPVKPELPQVIVAVEMASPDAAEQFEPEAELNSDEKRATVSRNEYAASLVLTNIKEAQSIYRNEKGRFATLEELAEAGVLDKEELDGFGYKFDIRVAGGRYEALATPVEYGKTGRKSFYMDETGVIRAGDQGGQPATSADKALSEKQTSDKN